MSNKGSKVLISGEIRVSLDAADGWTCGWISNRRRAPVKSHSSKVEVVYWYWLVSLKMSQLDLFRLKMDTKSTPKHTVFEETFF